MSSVKASSGDRVVASAGVRAKKPRQLSIPVRDIDDLENIACGFRLSIGTVSQGDKEIGYVSSGGGLGSPWIVVSWRGRAVAIHAQELLRAHVAKIAPADLPLLEDE